MTEIEVKAENEVNFGTIINDVINLTNLIIARGQKIDKEIWGFRYEFDLKMKVYHLLPPTNNFKLYVTEETKTSQKLKFVFRYDTDLKISKAIANVLEAIFPLNVKVL